jgi:hypothetical protein
VRRVMDSGTIVVGLGPAEPIPQASHELRCSEQQASCVGVVIGRVVPSAVSVSFQRERPGRRSLYYAESRLRFFRVLFLPPIRQSPASWSGRMLQVWWGSLWNPLRRQ